MIEASLYLLGLFVFLFAGVHVATVMFLLAIFGAVFGLGGNAWHMLGTFAWTTQNNFILVAAPLFILAGEIMLRSGVADRMYQAMSAWLGWLPGGLLHTNIGACALFAATSGSSVATAATIGTVALPSLSSRGYNERLSLGSLCAGGTLGILIPPSINMIIYGAMTNTSIGRLFAGGIVPGLILTGIFMLTILALSMTGRYRSRREPWPPLRERLFALLDMVPPVTIFLVVMGSIYFGWATPTEAAALAVVAAVVLAALGGRLTIAMLNECFRSTVQITGMMMLIVIAAFFLNFVVSLVGVPRAISSWVESTGISPMQTIYLLFLIYLILGCIMETLSMMVTTIPVIVPLVVTLGFDPVWFGIFIVLMCELALVTPPVGMNLYVIQGIRKGPGSINDVIIGSMPFVAGMCVMTVILIHFPDLALWLPNLLFD